MTEDDLDVDRQPHRRYTVTLRALNGASTDVQVITNRGVAKAAYMAARAWRLRRMDALDVKVVDDGPPTLDRNGVPEFRGYALDRNEW